MASTKQMPKSDTLSATLEAHVSRNRSHVAGQASVGENFSRRDEGRGPARRTRHHSMLPTYMVNDDVATPSSPPLCKMGLTIIVKRLSAGGERQVQPVIQSRTSHRSRPAEVLEQRGKPIEGR
jgi:hypothetical protein